MKKITPDLLLRLGLGLTLLYAGINSILNPDSWIGFVPDWTEKIISKEIFLTTHGIFEILLATTLITGFQKKISALLAFFSFASIIIFYGIDEITFRDLGLLFSALALFLIHKEKDL